MLIVCFKRICPSNNLNIYTEWIHIPHEESWSKSYQSSAKFNIQLQSGMFRHFIIYFRMEIKFAFLYEQWFHEGIQNSKFDMNEKTDFNVLYNYPLSSWFIEYNWIRLYVLWAKICFIHRYNECRFIIINDINYLKWKCS